MKNNPLLRTLTEQEEELVVGGIPSTPNYLFSQEIKLLKNIRKVLNHKLF